MPKSVKWDLPGFVHIFAGAVRLHAYGNIVSRSCSLNLNLQGVVNITEMGVNITEISSKKEGYLTLSDFCRAKLVKKREIKKVEASKEFVLLVRKLDYELNKIGVNLNQVSKRINSNSIYQFTSGDRDVFRQIFGELRSCFSILQKYMDKIEDGPSQT